MRQLEHKEVVNSQPTVEIVLVLDRISDLSNVGMAFRLAEAFGVKQCYFPEGYTPEITEKFKRISRSTVSRVGMSTYQDEVALVKELKSDDYEVVGIELCDKSIDISNYITPKSRKVALIIGSEVSGVAPGLLDNADEVCHIPMYGMNSSINVVTALGIALSRIQQ